MRELTEEKNWELQSSNKREAHSQRRIADLERKLQYALDEKERVNRLNGELRAQLRERAQLRNPALSPVKGSKPKMMPGDIKFTRAVSRLLR